MVDRLVGDSPTVAALQRVQQLRPDVFASIRASQGIVDEDFMAVLKCVSSVSGNVWLVVKCLKL